MSKKSNVINPRIAILDGFRAVAILCVMFFHFFSRWTPPRNQVSLYPYKNDYNYFNYGYLGVQFFFIISGFVIFFTLDRTKSFNAFWKKRLIRLVPAMVFASLITFIIFRFFDPSFLFPASHMAINFWPGITFISPYLLNKFLYAFNLHVDYLNYSYWSLWPEIQFYLFCSMLFYTNQKKFTRNFLAASITMIVVNYFFQNILGSNKFNIILPANLLNAYLKWIPQGFNLVTFLPFFSIGILFYILFKNKQSNVAVPLFIKLCLAIFIGYAIYSGIEFPVRLIYVAMFVAFFGFIYYPAKLSVFEKKQLTGIGESSYFLYLLHENIGILIIYSFGKYFLPYGFVFTLLVMYLLIAVSRLYSFKIDKKLNYRLKAKMLSKEAQKMISGKPLVKGVYSS